MQTKPVAIRHWAQSRVEPGFLRPKTRVCVCVCALYDVDFLWTLQQVSVANMFVSILHWQGWNYVIMFLMFLFVLFCSHSSCEGWHYDAFAESVLVCVLANGSKWVGAFPLWTSQVAESNWRRNGFAIESSLTVSKHIWICTVGKPCRYIRWNPSMFSTLLSLST